MSPAFPATGLRGPLHADPEPSATQPDLHPDLNLFMTPSRKNVCPQCGRPKFDPWVRKKKMATQSSIVAWKIPWMEEPGRLQFMGSQRVGHDWATSLSFPFRAGRGASPPHLPGSPLGLLSALFHTSPPLYPTHHHHPLQEAKRECPGSLVVTGPPCPQWVEMGQRDWVMASLVPSRLPKGFWAPPPHTHTSISIHT